MFFLPLITAGELHMDLTLHGCSSLWRGPYTLSKNDVFCISVVPFPLIAVIVGVVCGIIVIILIIIIVIVIKRIR
jgi:hypothetical protein